MWNPAFHPFLAAAMNAAGFQFQNMADAPGHFPGVMRDKDEARMGLPNDPVHSGKQ